jgi:glycosyltransferase involved in cell wall biosynthesis
MKICIVSNLYEPYVLGGAEIYVSKIVGYLIKNTQHQVVLVTTRPNVGLLSLIPQKEIIGNNLTIYRFFPLNLYHSYNTDKIPIWVRPFWHIVDLWNIHSYFLIKKILKKEKPDIIHTHNITGFSTSLFSVIRKLKISHIHTLHDYQLLSPWAILYRKNKIIDHFNLLEKVFYKIKKYFTKSPKIILAPSQFVIDKHREYGFFRDSKFLHLPLGIESDDVIKQHNKIVNIVYFGQLVSHKGIAILLRAFSEIENDNIKLHIAGTGPLLKSLKEAHKRDQRITFYGFITGNKKIDLWRKADITVVPSVWYENSPVTIYEAFKNKAAVIASAIGGIKELINNKNGLLFKTKNSEDLKEKLQLLINNEQLRKNLAENAYKDYIKYYTIEKYFKKLKKIYQDAIS